MTGLLFIVIGPAGVGKNTVISEILRSSSNLSFLPSYTSRPVREGESEGHPYHFVDRDKFEQMIKNEEFVEWKFVHGNNYYGMNKALVEDMLSQNKNLITDVEVLGAIDIIDFFPNNCISIFINVSSEEELSNRIKKRGSVEEKDLAQRLKRLDLEKQYQFHFDYLIHNHELSKTIDEFSKIIDLEIQLNHYRQLKSESDILHHSIQIIIENSRNRLLFYKQKCPFPADDWHLLSSHILNNETPIDTLYRVIQQLFPSISGQSKEIFQAIFPSLARKKFLKNHYHYEITFKLLLDLPEINSENYEYRWMSNEQAKGYLDDEEMRLIS